MAGFSKKVGYHIESSPKLNSNGKPMRTASGKTKTVETVTGREGDAEQLGVRLLVTRGRKTQHTRKSDGKTINDFYLTIVKANDCTSNKYMNQVSARPELRNDAIIVHNGNKLDVRYQHEFQFSAPEGETNDKLDLISEYAIGPDGQDASIEDLVDGKVSCLAFNAAVRPYRLSNTDWQSRREAAKTRYPDLTVPETRSMYTSFSVVLERNEDGAGLYMSKPSIAPSMEKHNRMTKKAVDMANDFSKQREAQQAAEVDIPDVEADIAEEEFDTFDL